MAKKLDLLGEIEVKGYRLFLIIIKMDILL